MSLRRIQWNALLFIVLIYWQTQASAAADATPEEGSNAYEDEDQDECGGACVVVRCNTRQYRFDVNSGREGGNGLTYPPT